MTVLIYGRAVEGSCFKGLDHVTKFLRRIRQETLVLLQCVCDGSVQVGQEVVNPGGAFCEVAQLPRQLLCRTHDESATIRMPGCVDDFVNLIDIGARDGDGESVCVQD